jgi:hypothetical protein
MKTEEILRYEIEFKEMGDAFGTTLLVYDFPKQYPDSRSQKLQPDEAKENLEKCVGAKHLKSWW